jgi:hypothetical protein
MMAVACVEEGCKKGRRYIILGWGGILLALSSSAHGPWQGVEVSSTTTSGPSEGTGQEDRARQGRAGQGRTGHGRAVQESVGRPVRDSIIYRRQREQKQTDFSCCSQRVWC